MNENVLRFVALAVSMLYGALFTTGLRDTSWFAPVGGVVVALCWIAAGMFGRGDERRTRSR